MGGDFNPVPKPKKSDRLKSQAEKRAARKEAARAQKLTERLESRHGRMGHNSIAWRPPKKSDAEHRHLRRVKELPCVCCNHPAPSDAHHVMSDRHGRPKASDYATIPVCKECHQNGRFAFHNDKSAWEKKHGKDWAFIPLVLAKLGIPTDFDFV